MMTQDQQTKTSETLSKVIDFCYNNLANDKKVLNYLTQKRFLSRETIDKFKIGAFPRNLYELIKHISSWDLFKAGIVFSEKDKIYSKFNYNNIIIPIYDVHNTAIGIIGRSSLTEEGMKLLNIPKYDNTKFPKGSHLFGLNLAKDSIRKQNKAIVVEGNFDAISAHQAGQTNVVASSGSWLTKRQHILLGRYTENIHLMLDNDEPGRKATKRLLARMPLEGVKMYDFPFPAVFKDPDEYFRKSN